jgi:hypothetical protein
MNSHYELCSLDVCDSGLDRLEKCMKCFPGPLINPAFDDGKKGFAATAPGDRLRLLLALARLMSDWWYCPCSESLATAKGKADWESELILALEENIARYYTQTFYHFFGCAAIIPLHLKHNSSV